MEKRRFSPVTLLVSAVLLLMASCSSEQSSAPLKEDKSLAGSAAAERTDPGLNGGASPEKAARGTSGNRPPVVVKADVKSVNENGTDVLRVVPVGLDPDGEPVTFVYEWTKNGEPAGNGDSIRGFKRGDKISAKITPYDGRLYGSQKILNTQISNTSPRVDMKSEPSFDGAVFTYHIKAEDPDGDKLSFALMESPRGMTINGETGVVDWRVGDQKGVFPVRAKVKDGSGGETLFEFTVNVTEEKATAQPKAN